MAIECVNSVTLKKAEKEASSSLENDGYKKGLEDLINKYQLPYYPQTLQDLMPSKSYLALAYNSMKLFLKSYAAIRFTMEDVKLLGSFQAKSMRDFRTKNDLLNLYSGFAASDEALTLIEEHYEPSNQELLAESAVERICDSMLGRSYDMHVSAQVSVILKKLMSVFNTLCWPNAKSEKDLLEITYLFLNNIKRIIEEKVQEYNGNGLVDGFSKLQIKITQDSGCVHEGFGLARQPEQHILTIKEDPFAEIIGDQNTISEIRNCLKIISYYNPETKLNPYFSEDEYIRPMVVLLQGKPGSGKSLVGEAAMSKLESIAVGRSCRAYCVKLTPDDIFGPHVGESEQKLRKKLNFVENDKGFGLLFIDDCDLGALKSRSIVRETSHAFDEVQRMLMDWLYRPGYKGNYFVLMATNFIENLDSAIVNRALVKNFEGATTPEELMQIFLNQTLKYRKYLSVSEVECRKLAEACTDFNALIKYADEKQEFSMLYKSTIARLSFLKELGSSVRFDGFSPLDYLFKISYFNREDFKFSGRDMNKLAGRVKNYIKNIDSLAERNPAVSDSEALNAINSSLKKISFPAILNYVIDQRLSLLDRQVALLAENVHKNYKSMVEQLLSTALYSQRLKK